MTPDVQAAIERTLERFDRLICPDKHDKDAAAVARYLRTLADPTPLSPDLLRERGYAATGWPHVFFRELGEMRLDIDSRDGEVELTNGIDSLVLPRPIRTVGDLRRLEELLLEDGA